MKRKLVLAAVVAACIAAPAHATGGLICRTAGARPIEVSLVVGHTAVSAIVSARLKDGGRVIPAQVAQAWLEPAELRIDLVDLNAARHELRLRAKRKGDTYDGSLWRLGQRRWVRCREG
jgi:hypothetical protein